MKPKQQLSERKIKSLPLLIAAAEDAPSSQVHAVDGKWDVEQELWMQPYNPEEQRWQEGQVEQLVEVKQTNRAVKSQYQMETPWYVQV